LDAASYKTGLNQRLIVANWLCICLLLHSIREWTGLRLQGICT